MGPNNMLPLLLMNEEKNNEDLLFFIMMSRNQEKCEPSDLVQPNFMYEETSYEKFRSWQK